MSRSASSSWRAADSVFGFLAGLLVAACSTDSTTPGVDGSAFPNRREHFELPAGDLGLVSNNGSDNLTLIDLTQRTVIGSAPAGRDPVDTDGPHHVVLDRATGLAFTALAYPVPSEAPGPHAAHGASQRPGQVLKLALGDFEPLGEVRVETNPGDIVLSEDGSRLVVSHFDLLRATARADLESRRASLAILDPAQIRARDSAAARLVKTCIAPHGVALSRPRGELAFVACYGEDAVAVVNTDDPGATPELVSVGLGGTPGSPLYGPYAAVLSHAGTRLAVSNTESKDVRFFDVEARAMQSVILPCDGAPYFPAWSPDDGQLFVPTQNPDGVLVFEGDGTEPIRRRSFELSECELPHEVSFGSDPSVLFVVCEGDHLTDSVVLALDAASLATIATLPVGVYPDRLAIGRAP